MLPGSLGPIVITRVLILLGLTNPLSLTTVSNSFFQQVCVPNGEFLIEDLCRAEEHGFNRRPFQQRNLILVVQCLKPYGHSQARSRVAFVQQ